ncbi:putative nuclease HARBI1 [Copidosoma floridanum]|uniref:putative nuclease HARBI1 n=1 Tax=Copidosoma floridanum TaxID=29053 RepID=UPI000C6F8F53|nr:putative nuclease HARBI1 [Copidosoma floridanum]
MLGIAAVLLGLNHERQERIEAREQLKLRRNFLRDSSDPFNIGDDVFKKMYRMYPRVTLLFIQMIENFLPVHELAVDPRLQVLAVLRFLAEGSYQKGAGNDLQHPMSQPTFSKYLYVVITAINRLRNRYIRFPVTHEDRENIQANFDHRLGFPGVIRAINCTLIKIFTPSDHEEAYVDRKNNHSLNAQMICDMNYRILSVRICSGSTKDRYVWRHSVNPNYMYHIRENVQEEPYYLIGCTHGQCMYKETRTNRNVAIKWHTYQATLVKSNATHASCL